MRSHGGGVRGDTVSAHFDWRGGGGVVSSSAGVYDFDGRRADAQDRVIGWGGDGAEGAGGHAGDQGIDNGGACAEQGLDGAINAVNRD